ncbi:hypothetical protein BSU04_33975 [Caballeronia sordidicola]|uniref:Uncharacterized protein n=1 Tax=Caballeronia sordidicola TaxID=196367 RepID=A0A226WSS2_CABSO|nr:hypothetical protein BSU04_33975 [Caballeronia sordidicola]
MRGECGTGRRPVQAQFASGPDKPTAAMRALMPAVMLALTRVQ